MPFVTSPITGSISPLTPSFRASSESSMSPNPNPNTGYPITRVVALGMGSRHNGSMTTFSNPTASMIR